MTYFGSGRQPAAAGRLNFAAGEVSLRRNPRARVVALCSRAKRSSSVCATKQKAQAQGLGFSLGRHSDDDLLSRGIPRTIIGAASFHGPVRNGKAWGQRAMVVREFVSQAARTNARPAQRVLEEVWVQRLHAHKRAPQTELAVIGSSLTGN